MADVDLVLNTDFRKATTNINRFSKDASASLDKLKSGFSGLKTLAIGIGSAFAVKKIVDAATEQERAVKSLNTALALTGEYSVESSREMQEFASALQANSTIGDEVSLSLVGLTKSMGATNDQTKDIIQAAADLSAVTGESLDTSVKNITKTLGGLKGELGETQPELAGLTVEQLKAGAAIDILGNKYKGAAASLKNTFGGAVDSAQNSFGDLLEEVGNLIIKNPVIIKAVNLAGKAFDELGKFVKENSDRIIDLTINVIAGFLQAVGVMIRGIGNLVVSFTNFDAIVDMAGLGLAELAVAGVDVADSIIKSFKSVISLGLDPVLEKIGDAAEALNSLGLIDDDALGDFKQTLEDIALDSSTSGLEAMIDDVEAFRDAARDKFDESSEKLVEVKDGFETAADKVGDFADSLKDMKKAGDEADKALSNLSETNADLEKAPKPFAEKEFLGGITGAQITGAAGATISGITKGGAGARGLLKGGVTAGAAAFGLPPEVAGPLGEMAGLLAQGPEQTRMMVEAFADEIPIMLENIAEALPVLFEALADKADVIVIALVEAMPSVAWALAIEVPIALAKTLPNAFGRMFTAFVEGVEYEFDKLFGDWEISIAGLVGGFGQGIQDAINELGKAPEKIKEGILDLRSSFVKSLSKGFDDFLKYLGTKGNDMVKYLASFIESFARAFYSAFVGLFQGLGNIVESSFVRAVDAMIERIKIALGVEGGGGGGGTLSSTERAVEAAQTFVESPGGALERGYNDAFKLTGGGPQPTQIIIQVGEKQLADVLLDLNRKGYRTA